MKKLFFVAVIAAAMVSCSESTTPAVNQDSINAAKAADSLKAAAAKMDTAAAKMDTAAAKMDTAAAKMK